MSYRPYLQPPKTNGCLVGFLWIVGVLVAVGFIGSLFAGLSKGTSDTSSSQQPAAPATDADPAHTRRQQIVDDFTTVFKISPIGELATKAFQNAEAGNVVDAYSEYDECASESMSLSNDEAESLPDYITHGENDTTNGEFVPQNVALAINAMCEDGKKAVNEPTAEHAAALQKSNISSGMRYGGMLVMYEHAYVAAGGHASDWAQMFPGINGT